MVVGNGYYWQEGELVTRDARTSQSFADMVAGRRAEFARRIAQAQATDAEFAESQRAAELVLGPCKGQDTALKQERRAHEYEFTVGRIDRMLDGSTPPESCNFYPCSLDCAKVFAFPDDAKPDWLMALDAYAAQALAILAFKSREGELDDSDRQYQEHLPLARQRIQALMTGFGG